MIGLRIIKRRIRAVNNIKKITNAMRLVASAKLKKLQNNLLLARRYQNEIESIFRLVYLACQGKKLTQELTDFLVHKVSDEVQPTAYIVFSSEKGLCGSYNTNIFRFIQGNINLKSSDFIIMGKKITISAVRHKFSVVKTYPQFAANFDASKLMGILQDVLKLYKEKNYSSVNIIYTKFINTMKYQVDVTQLLPIITHSNDKDVRSVFEMDGASARAMHRNEIEKIWYFEPTPEVFLGKIIYKYLISKIYHCFIESLTSEQASRMVAMRNATDNAQELIDELTIVFNKARQSAITRELLDIISTTEALK